MSLKAELGDLALTAFMSSKICHDFVGPIGAINNALELLEEETDEATRAYAYEVIESSARSAWTRLEFARLAFGASSNLGPGVSLSHAEATARGFVEEDKRRQHILNWHAPAGLSFDKPYVRLLMVIIAMALPAVPGGGEINVDITGDETTLNCEVTCRGRAARIPEGIVDILAGRNLDRVDPRSILPYYAGRLADELGLAINIRKVGEDVLFALAPDAGKANAAA